MSDQVNAEQSQRRGFLDKRVALRWALLAAGILIIAALIIWALKSLECGSIASSCDRTLQASARDTASAVAKSIAIVGNRQIVDEQYESVQRHADELVSAKPITYIALVTTAGDTVVHTDRGLLGRKWSEPEETPDVVHGSAKVMSSTRQVATVYVGVRVPQRR